MRQSELVGVSLEIEALPIADDDSPTDQTAGTVDHRLAIALLLLVVCLATVVWYFRQSIIARWRSWRKQRDEREAAYFQRFVVAARSNDASAALNALYRWLDRAHDGPGVARLNPYVEAYGDDQTRRDVESLICASTDGGAWDGRALVSRIGAVRKDSLRAQQRRGKSAQALPPLNPNHTAPTARR